MRSFKLAGELFINKERERIGSTFDSVWPDDIYESLPIIEANGTLYFLTNDIQANCISDAMEEMSTILTNMEDIPAGRVIICEIIDHESCNSRFGVGQAVKFEK